MAVAFTLLLALAAGAQSPTISFMSARIFEAGVGPRHLATGDLNGDGFPDLVAANEGDPIQASVTVSVHLGDGTGSFLRAPDLVAGKGPTSAVIRDFDQDGDADIAVASACRGEAACSPRLTLFMGDGTGHFMDEFDIAIDPYVQAMASEDFNGDGMHDIALASTSYNRMQVCLGQSGGGFTLLPPFSTGSGPLSITGGDFNGDGRPDLAAVNAGYGANSLSVHLGDGQGGFGELGEFPAGEFPAFVHSADLNQDGRLDLYVSSRISNSAHFLLGDGLGGFASPSPLAAPDLPIAAVTGDFNGDSNIDLALTTDFGAVALLLGNGSGQFESRRVFAGGGGQSAFLVQEDFNRDGKPDLAVANRYPDGISVLLGRGGGAFEATEQFGPFGIFYGMENGDINEDGFQDIAVAAGDAVSVVLGLGNATFASPMAIPMGETAVTAVRLADFNLDSHLDIAAALIPHNGMSEIRILLGDGAGSFGPPVSYPVGDGAVAIAVTDFNADGKPDLAVTNTWENNISVLLGDGSGGFTSPGTVAVGFAPFGLAAGDFNGDKIQDLAVANQTQSELPNTVSILTGRGDGSFATAVNYVAGTNPMGVAVADFDRNGKLDLAISNYSEVDGVSTVSILLGNGDASFSPPAHHTVGLYPKAIRVGDFNGDGLVDLVAANEGSGNFSILIGDGTGGFSSTLHFGAGDTPAVLASGDFSGDGKHDIVVGNTSSGTFSLAINVTPGTNTVAGTDVSVQPVYPVSGTTPMTATFSEVSEPGMTSVFTGSSGFSPPSGFQLGSPATFFDVATTSVFSGLVTVCFEYDAVLYQDESQVKLLHHEGGAWVDRTTSLDMGNDVVCGEVSSFSPFLLAEPEVVFKRVVIDVEPHDSDNRLNSRSQGKVQVAIFSSEDFDAADIDVSTLTFGRTGNEASYFRHTFGDFDRDGRRDMVAFFEMKFTGLVTGDTVAILKGKSGNGKPFRGKDKVRLDIP